MCVTVPSMRSPPSTVAEGVRCVTANALAQIDAPAARYMVVGAGKTGMDVCLWVLRNRVPADAIAWVMPRDAWPLDCSSRCGFVRCSVPRSSAMPRRAAVIAPRVTAATIANQRRREQTPELVAWLAGARLDRSGRLAPKLPGDAAARAAAARMMVALPTRQAEKLTALHAAAVGDPARPVAPRLFGQRRRIDRSATDVAPVFERFHRAMATWRSAPRFL